MLWAPAHTIVVTNPLSPGILRASIQTQINGVIAKSTVGPWLGRNRTQPPHRQCKAPYLHRVGKKKLPGTSVHIPAVRLMHSKHRRRMLAVAAERSASTREDSAHLVPTGWSISFNTTVWSERRETEIWRQIRSQQIKNTTIWNAEAGYEKERGQGRMRTNKPSGGYTNENVKYAGIYPLPSSVILGGTRKKSRVSLLWTGACADNGDYAR